jgi:hypothetical protein
MDCCCTQQQIVSTKREMKYKLGQVHSKNACDPNLKLKTLKNKIKIKLNSKEKTNSNNKTLF